MRTTARTCSRILRIGALELKNSVALFRSLDRALTITLGQLLNDSFERLSECFDLEMLGSVVAAANVAGDDGVERRNEPLAGAHACDHVEQRQQPVLRSGEARIGCGDVVAAASRPATARLDQLDMKKQALEGVAEEQRPLELRRAPRHAEIVTEKTPSPAVDHRMGQFESIRAAQPRQVIDPGVFIEIRRECAELRPAGVVDDEIARHRGQRVAVTRIRNLPLETVTTFRAITAS